MDETIHRFIIQPGGCLRGTLRVPGDKSISHRAVMLGAIAEGRTEIDGFLEAQDCMATLNTLRAMGVAIEGPHQSQVVIHGVGKAGLKSPGHPLDLGNSGTSMRLLAGLLSGQKFAVELTGDASLLQRPMRRVIEPLVQMGATIEASSRGTAPLVIKPATTLHAIDYAMPVASAQVKSSILLAGLYATGITCVTELAPTRDHTERMLRCFGCHVRSHNTQICLSGGQRLSGTSIAVPADISSAAFFMVGASIAQGSELVLEHVGVNSTRTGVIEILRLMGAKIDLFNSSNSGDEPVADIRVMSAQLRGVEIPLSLVPLAIDEFPAIFIAAACAEGQTVVRGVQELRVKESDRLAVMANGLWALGISTQLTADGIIIQGGQIKGGIVDSHGDHRVAMAFAVAGLRATEPIVIEDCRNVDTSFPGFWYVAKRVGLNASFEC